MGHHGEDATALFLGLPFASVVSSGERGLATGAGAAWTAAEGSHAPVGLMGGIVGANGGAPVCAMGRPAEGAEDGPPIIISR